MGRDELEQLLDFATRDWRADWRGNFGGETTRSKEAPISWRFISTFIACVIASQASIVGIT